MNYKAQIKTTLENPKNLAKLLANDELKGNRGKYTFKTNKNTLIFNIVAKDSVALRTLLTTITKYLEIYEKSQKI